MEVERLEGIEGDCLNVVLGCLTIRDVAALCSCDKKWLGRIWDVVATCRRLAWKLSMGAEYHAIVEEGDVDRFDMPSVSMRVELLQDVFLLEYMLANQRQKSINSRVWCTVASWMQPLATPRTWNGARMMVGGPLYLHVPSMTIAIERRTSGMTMVIRAEVHSQFRQEFPFHVWRMEVVVPVGCGNTQDTPFSRPRKWLFGTGSTVRDVRNVNECFVELGAVKIAEMRHHTRWPHGSKLSADTDVTARVFLGAVGRQVRTAPSEYVSSRDWSSVKRNRTSRADRHYIVLKVSGVPHLPPFLLPRDMVDALS